MAKRYALGMDFGTESGRALLVDVETGEEVASHVLAYPHGVMDEQLPDQTPLEADWALQHPGDWLEVLKVTIPVVLMEADAKAEQVIGLGVSFTSCTMLPVTQEGEPLCNLAPYQNRPHAWPKLWKHHAAQPEADQITQQIEESGDPLLERYGGKMSSEWLFPKILQALHEDEAVYDAAARFLEGGDWIVQQLCGHEARSSCMAGYKGMWDAEAGYPSAALLGALHPKFANVVEEKLSSDIRPLGTRAGELSEAGAQLTGLPAGTAVAVAAIDAHAAVPGSSVTEAGKMVLVLGTSTCHMLLSKENYTIDGMCGRVKDGILPGYYGYEAGQPAVGDIFAWFVDHFASADLQKEAEAELVHVHKLLEQKAAQLTPGSNGLVALDWWNGNRSVLVDAELSGLIIGLTLSTRPEEIYRALLEATAFGTRRIIESFTEAGVAINELYACGGLPQRNRLLMQIYADVTGLPIYVSESPQASALGAAILGAVAAGKGNGGYDSPADAAKRMARLQSKSYKPTADAHKAYSQLYQAYLELHDHFGRGGSDVMRRLRQIRQGA